MIQNQHQLPGDERTDGGHRGLDGIRSLRGIRTSGPVALAAAAAALTLGLGAAPAHARPDAGQLVGPATVTAHRGAVGECLLQRVGAQYVRCDDLTGAGVPAPAWVPRR